MKIALIIAGIFIFAGTELLAQESYPEINGKRNKFKRYELGFNYGTLIMNSNSRSSFNDSPLDLYGNKEMYGFIFGYALKDQFALRMLFNLIISSPVIRGGISNDGDGLSVNLNGKGGAIVNLNIGGRYYFLYEAFRPYLSLYPGFVYTVAKGGTATGRLSGIKKEIITEKGSGLSVRLDGGFAYNLTETFKVDFNIGYQVSQKYKKPAGGLDNFNGWNISAGFGFVF